MRTFLAGLILLSACSHVNIESPHIFSELCGKSFTGKVVSTEAVDEHWRKEILVLGPVSCATSDSIQLPLAVGSNQSRTWIITGQASTLELRHQHLLENGDIDPVSDYGGSIRGTPVHENDKWTMDFPADAKTIAIFTANDLEVSNSNVWRIELTPGNLLAYELNRENRYFRAEFDLKNPR